MKNLLLLPLLCSLVACGSKDEAKAAETKPATEVPTTELSVQVSAEHNVLCGCKIESIGSCGNYIEFDGEYAKITNSKDVDLGGMEWCSSEGDRAVVTGVRTGDEFVATEITVVE